MGLFSSECGHCGSKEHATGNCPHGLFSSKCAHCGSTNHATGDCPHGIFSPKCGHCGSTEHATSDCPHGVFSSKCGHCGSVNHATSDCPHGIFSPKCGNCGSRDHPTNDCPQGAFASPRETSHESSDGSIGGILWLVLGVAALFLMLFVAISVLITIPIWMGAAAIAGIIAYFHAATVAAQIASSPPQPSAVARKRDRAPYYRFQRESLKVALAFSKVLWMPVASAAGFAALMAVIMGAANQRDQVGTAMFIGAVGLALIVSYRWSKRVYLWRLSEILLEHRQIDTGRAGAIARTWNVLSIAFLGLLVVGMIVSVAQSGAPRFSNRPEEVPFNRFSSAPDKAQNNRLADTAASLAIVEPRQTTVTPEPLFRSAATTPSPAASQIDPVNQSRDNSTASGETWSVFTGERFPQTRTQALSDGDISSWSSADIQYAINEIFARRGAEFPDKQVSASFNQFAWYHPQAGVGLDQIESSMPGVERWNVHVLGNARNSRKSNQMTSSVQQTIPQQAPAFNTQIQNTQPDYPIAQWSLYNGTVFSPYPPNNLIRVDNVPPGSLVTDPTTNGIFRAPYQPPDPQIFPIAQWSNVPGHVISPYPPNVLMNVSDVPLGTLRVDLTTNGVFRTPYNPGPSVNPGQIVGGLLNGISQAIQNSGNSGTQRSQSVRQRRRSP